MTDTFLSRVLAALQAEFADIDDVKQVVQILVRLALAAALGGLLGYERERQGKAAGLRTHMLVAMGAALFVLVPLQAGMGIGDLSRVVQGLVAGIGFLGAGAIVKHGVGSHDGALRHEGNVQGLTTAAGVWMTAAIGVACGLGREWTAVLSTLLALAVLALVPKLVDPDPKPADDASAPGNGRPPA